jgi:hypothetical protein
MRNFMCFLPRNLNQSDPSRADQRPIEGEIPVRGK